MYNKEGAAYKNKLQWGGRRERRSILPLDQERALFKSIEAKSLIGEILTAKDISKEVEKQVGREVSQDYIREQKKFNNYTFKTLGDVDTQLSKTLKELNDEKDVLKPMCNFYWLTSSS